MGHKELVEEFLKREPMPPQKPYVALACQFSKFDTANALLQAGADPNLELYRGGGPPLVSLLVALFVEHKDHVETMLMAGGQVPGPTAQRMEKGLRTVAQLIQAGADVNMKGGQSNRSAGTMMSQILQSGRDQRGMFPLVKTIKDWFSIEDKDGLYTIRCLVDVEKAPPVLVQRPKRMKYRGFGGMMPIMGFDEDDEDGYSDDEEEDRPPSTYGYESDDYVEYYTQA